MSDVDVVVVGAVQNGLALATELRQAGANCRVLERRAAEPNQTTAIAVHARTLELLDARGLAESVISRGIPVQQISPTPGTTVDLTKLRTRYPMVVMVPQSGTEHLLEERARQLGAEIIRGAEVVGVSQDGDEVRTDA